MGQCELVTLLPTFLASIPRAAKFPIDRVSLCASVINIKASALATVSALACMALALPSSAETHSSHDASHQPGSAKDISHTFPPSVQLKDRSVHDVNAQIAAHEYLLAQETPDGDRIAPGIIRHRPATHDHTLNASSDRLILSTSASKGSISIVDGSPGNFSVRLSVASPLKPSAAVDVAGSFSSANAAGPEREGVWAAWERSIGVLVIARYRQGVLSECYLYSEGKQERAMSLDDDMSRDRGKVPHRYVAKAMDVASEAVLDASRQTVRADRLTNQKRLRDQKRLYYRQITYIVQSRGVDQHLDAIAYQEALRASTATMLLEVFPCVPSRHAFIFSPVNLLSQPKRSSY